MDLNKFKSIIDQYAKDVFLASGKNVGWMGTCLHHFGESLLHPQFDEAIAYAQGAGVDVCLSFNPIVLSKNKAERLFKAKPAILYACLDGYDNNSFERIRGVKDAYEDSVKNILIAFEYRERYSPQTDLRLTIIDIPVYYESISSVCDWWKREYGIEVYRKKFTTWNTSDPQINALADVPQEIKEKACDIVVPVADVCTTPWTHLSIGYDGTVLPCCRDYNNFYSVGNVSSTPLMKIWNNPEMQNLRKELRSGFVFNELCRNCERTVHRN
jgi:radical SAM protein with 4Fe4S-binding SPASM domain